MCCLRPPRGSQRPCWLGLGHLRTVTLTTDFFLGTCSCSELLLLPGSALGLHEAVAVPPAAGVAWGVPLVTLGQVAHRSSLWCRARPRTLFFVESLLSAGWAPRRTTPAARTPTAPCCSATSAPRRSCAGSPPSGWSARSGSTPTLTSRCVCAGCGGACRIRQQGPGHLPPVPAPVPYRLLPGELLGLVVSLFTELCCSEPGVTFPARLSVPNWLRGDADLSTASRRGKGQRGRAPGGAGLKVGSRAARASSGTGTGVRVAPRPARL